MRLDPHDLQEIADAVVARLESRATGAALVGERLAYGEAEAAELLGLPKNTLRERRLNGDVRATKVGKRYLYSRAELLKLLGE